METANLNLARLNLHFAFLPHAALQLHSARNRIHFTSTDSTPQAFSAPLSASMLSTPTPFYTYIVSARYSLQPCISFPYIRTASTAFFIIF
jgi:hypothetical protein